MTDDELAARLLADSGSCASRWSATDRGHRRPRRGDLEGLAGDLTPARCVGGQAWPPDPGATTDPGTGDDHDRADHGPRPVADHDAPAGEDAEPLADEHQADQAP